MTAIQACYSRRACCCCILACATSKMNNLPLETLSKSPLPSFPMETYTMLCEQLLLHQRLVVVRMGRVVVCDGGLPRHLGEPVRQ